MLGAASGSTSNLLGRLPARMALAPGLDLRIGLVALALQEESRALELGAQEVIAPHRLRDLRHLLVAVLRADRVHGSTFGGGVQEDGRPAAVEARHKIRDVDLLLPEERL